MENRLVITQGIEWKEKVNGYKDFGERGGKNVLKLKYGKGCITVSILKPTDFHTLNR